VAREQPPAVNHTWAVDFVHDALSDGRRFRALTVIDEYSRECLAIEVGASLPGERVSQVLPGYASCGRCQASFVPITDRSFAGG